MKKRSGCLAAVGVGFVLCVGVTTGLPILASGLADPSAPDGMVCGGGHVDPLTDGTPSILGPSALTAAELTDWWSDSGRRQPSRLAMSVDDLIGRYLDEGENEGVRGEIAFAQAVHETGWFASADTALNNFAGIAHSDGEATDQAFPDPGTGIRAQIQLLKKFAVGNEVQLAYPDVAPDAAAAARTWGQLAGTWATGDDYWTGISAIYDSMLRSAGREVPVTPPMDPGSCEPPPAIPGDGVQDGELTEVRGIVVHVSIAADLDALLAAAEADGLSLTGSGHRSFDRQVELRRAHCGTSHYAIYVTPARECSPPTARPGTSLHESGLAIDFRGCSSRSTRCWQWLDANAATSGFYNLPSEPWHWSVDGS